MTELGIHSPGLTGNANQSRHGAAGVPKKREVRGSGIVRRPYFVDSWVASPMDSVRSTALVFSCLAG